MKWLVVFFVVVPAFAQLAVEDFRVSGIVVDHATNRQLKKVLVELLQMSKSQGEVSVVTSEDGRFNFLHVPKGKYQLIAEKRGQSPVPYNQTDGGYASAIVVDGKLDTSNIVFALYSDAHIDGVVMGDDGEPVRNAQLTVFRETVNDGEAETVQIQGTNTNSAGHFHLGHLQHGKYYLAVSATPWFAQQDLQQHQSVYPVTFYGNTSDGRSARPITLAEGQSAEVQINLRAAPGISVKLPSNSRGVAVFVPGPGDSQIPVPVQYNQTAQGFPMSLPRNGRGMVMNAAPDGPPPEHSMELTNLAAGRYKVAVFGDSGGFSQTSQIVELTNGSTLDIDRLTGSSISGKILFGGAAAPPHLQVFLNSHNQGGTDTPVAADGTFHFDKVSPGSYQLNLPDPQLAITSLTATGANVLHDELVVPSGAAVDLTLQVTLADTLSTLDGVATQNGRGLAGAMVLLMPEDTHRARVIRRDQSDADGSFSLANILPGRYTLIAIDDGHDLAYKTESVIKPYLAGGVSLAFPLTSNNPVQVPVQSRKP